MHSQTIEGRSGKLISELEPLLTVDEAAAIIRRSHWTMRKYIAEGSIAGVRIGRDLLIEPAELRRFINRGKN